MTKKVSQSLLADIIYESCIYPSLEKEPAKIVVVAKAYLELGIKGLTHFSEGRLKKLDPLVGDNACQKRTIMTINLYEESRTEGHQKVKEALATAVLALENLCKFLPADKKGKEMLDEQLAALEKSLPPDKKGKELLRAVIGDLKGEASWNTQMLSYILTKSRSKTNPLETDHESLKGLPMEKAKVYRDDGKDRDERTCVKVIFKMKEQLAKASVAYLKILGSPNKTLLKLIEKDTIETTGIKMTPCYLNLKLIMSAVHEKGVPLAIVIRREERCKTLYLEKVEGQYQKKEPLPSQNMSLFLLDGVTELDTPEEAISRLFGDAHSVRKEDLEKVVLSNAANHPPYTANTVIRMKKIEELPVFNTPALKVLLKRKQEEPEKSYQVLVEEEAKKSPCAGKYKQTYGSNPDLTLDKVMVEYEKYVAHKAATEILSLFKLKHIYPATIKELEQG
jgi:hypothetical protein